MIGVFFCVPQKQSKDRFGLEGDEESTMLEESVSPKKCVNKAPIGCTKREFHAPLSS